MNPEEEVYLARHKKSAIEYNGVKQASIEKTARPCDWGIVISLSEGAG